MRRNTIMNFHISLTPLSLLTFGISTFVTNSETHPLFFKPNSQSLVINILCSD